MNKILISCFLLAFIIACAGKEKKAPGEVSVAEGEHVYKKYCIICHGSDGKLGINGAKDITVSKLTLEEREIQIKKGKNTMTPFEGVLTEEQIKSVALYSMNFK